MSNTGRNTVLVVFPGGMIPVRGGGALRTWMLVDNLRRRGYQVELVTASYPDAGDESEVESRVDKLWTPRRATENSSVKSAGPNGLALRLVRTKSRVMELLNRALGWRERLELASKPQNIFTVNRRHGIEDLTQRAAYASRPFAAIATYGWTAHALDRMPPGTLRILDTIDVQHTRRDIAAEAGGDLSHIVCTREEEIAELERADVLLAIQREEYEELKTMCPDREVLLVEHGYAMLDYAASDSESTDVLYVGNLYDPNVIGLKHFLATVWPKVREAVPTCRMLVCGRICEAFSKQIPGVSFEGVVRDLADYYRRAAVAVNPVLYGSGLKIKSIEAMAHGRCLVCSEAGTQGLDASVDLPVVVANDAASMASEIARLLQDTEYRWGLERRAHEYARQRYGQDAVYRDLHALLERHANQSQHG